MVADRETSADDASERPRRKTSSLAGTASLNVKHEESNDFRYKFCFRFVARVASTAILDEVASTILRHPDLASVYIYPLIYIAKGPYNPTHNTQEKSPYTRHQCTHIPSNAMHLPPTQSLSPTYILSINIPLPPSSTHPPLVSPSSPFLSSHHPLPPKKPSAFHQRQIPKSQRPLAPPRLLLLLLIALPLPVKQTDAVLDRVDGVADEAEDEEQADDDDGDDEVALHHCGPWVV